MPLDLLSVAKRAALRASELCLRVLAESGERPESMAKAGREPVTIADYGSQAVILAEIASAFPEHRVIAEEGAEHLRREAGPTGAAQIVELVSESLGRSADLDEVSALIDHRGGDSSPYTWVIDPIDGTKGFLRREQFAVAVGLLRTGRVCAGVLACPHLPVDPSDPGRGMGVLFAALEGGGATVEPLTGGRPLQVLVSDVSEPAAVRLLGSVESAHGDPALMRAAIAHGGLGGGMVRMDSQAKYGAVAAGMAEVYLRPRSRPDYRENVWDHAAGVAVVTEAGGLVTDLDGLPLDFSLGPQLSANRGVLVSNGRVHEMLLAALREAETETSSGA